MIKDFYEVTAGAAAPSIKSNYHTHNYLCGHACGTVSDYVAAAVELGLENIGISDHFACPLGSYDAYITHKTLRTQYLSQFASARKKYGDRINIYSGVEIEYFDGFDDYFAPLTAALDYLVLGQHEYICRGRRCSSFFDGTDEDNVVAYCECAERGVRSGLFALLAHPDLIFYRKPTVTPRMARAFDSLIAAAAECDVAVELNANGIRSHSFRYPTDLLIGSCKKHGAPVAVSSDCHSPDCLVDGYVTALYAYAKAVGLRVVDELPKLKR